MDCHLDAQEYVSTFQKSLWTSYFPDFPFKLFASLLFAPAAFIDLEISEWKDSRLYLLFYLGEMFTVIDVCKET